MKAKRIECKTNEAWRKERAKSIGASAVGTILGENHFTTPIQLAERMKAELRGEFDYTQSRAMRRGHAYEPGVAEMWSEATGKRIIKSSSTEYILRREDIKFMHCSPDRTYWIDDNAPKNESNKGILECKTRNSFFALESIPLSWEYQLQIQLGISGCREGYIAWDCLGCPYEDGFGFKRYDFDKQMFEDAVVICQDFWDRCIIGDEIPEPTCSRDVVRRFPTSVEGKTITASTDIINLIDSIKDMQFECKMLENQIKDAKESVALLFEDEEAIIDPNSGLAIVTYKSCAGRTTVDSKKLQEEYPEVYQDCIKVGKGTRSMIIK